LIAIISHNPLRYLEKKWWKEKDPSKLPSYEVIKGEEEPEQPDISEDEGILDKQDEFEAKYNFRFEEPDAAKVRVLLLCMVSNQHRNRCMCLSSGVCTICNSCK